MEENIPYPTFEIFISSISLQAMICMGIIESPITGKIEKNLRQARFIIDTLDMLRDKTSGNLDMNEKAFLEDTIANLKLNYAKKESEEKQ